MNHGQAAHVPHVYEPGVSADWSTTAVMSCLVPRSLAGHSDPDGPAQAGPSGSPGRATGLSPHPAALSTRLRTTVEGQRPVAHHQNYVGGYAFPDRSVMGRPLFLVLGCCWSG